MIAGVSYSIHPIGFIRSEFKSRDTEPRHGTEGAPAASLEILSDFLLGVSSLQVGDEIIVVTWLHRARRGILEVYQRNDPAQPQTGVFSTRSPDRPNPLGLHRVKVIEIGSGRLRIGPIEAIDGTPVIDLKSVTDQGDS